MRQTNGLSIDQVQLIFHIFQQPLADPSQPSSEPKQPKQWGSWMKKRCATTCWRKQKWSILHSPNIWEIQSKDAKAMCWRTCWNTMNTMLTIDNSMLFFAIQSQGWELLMTPTFTCRSRNFTKVARTILCPKPVARLHQCTYCASLHGKAPVVTPRRYTELGMYRHQV